LVWGNCQADPLADLLTAPLRAAGIEMLRVPPVFLATADELAEVHDEVSRCRLLLSQPVSEEYPLPGSGTAHLASLLPPEGRLLTFPVVFHVGAFPYQVHGYDEADGRVDAPMTDYHDLRVVWAAAHGFTASEALRQWPTPPADGVRAVHEASLAEITRRERELDVTCSALLARPDAVWTMDHPSNTVLAATARAVLQVLDLPDEAMNVRQREYLGQRRTPVEPAVAAALGWPAEGTATEWIIDGHTVPNSQLLEVQLAFYRERPDVVTRTLFRAADRMQKLGLPR
jgi:Polysaccharide biosynthesis enzyme WcbI